ncbi:MAG: MBL fold metallo-hydrolase, partial [Clostridiales bacterium]|nr:MBL fold metallo-hydrolase [Clostridiales bacterium]
MGSKLVISLKVGQISTNCYIVFDESTLDAIVIDPGDDANHIMDEIRKNNLNVGYILLTHGHFDHFFAARTILQKIEAKIVLHEADNELLNSGGGFLMFFDRESEVEKNRVTADILIKDGDIISIKNIDFKFISTPGHT